MTSPAPGQNALAKTDISSPQTEKTVRCEVSFKSKVEVIARAAAEG